MELDDAGRARALDLVRRLRDPRLPDEETDPLLTELERLLVNPHVSDLIFYHDPELTDDEVVTHARRYEPFAL
ncbi:hypothetical protein J2S43_003230 [Catenuloplanes nepalensis]|uniref:E9imm peptide n=1 Tax=Catenuloplanes nepalensis TaxID=587533 RepID=A0ABT9MTY1_9ACTN|nr:e9imm peptide [Catenuloplanes nepalensis]MDP9794718.1 hypothetical protein [Catenuloplanes nepalensis]